MTLKRILIGATALISLALAACGSSSTAGAATTSAPTATTAPATNMVVAVATATVAGKSEQILTGTNGMTLYYFTPDTSTTPACVAACLGNWPPLLSTGGTPAGPATLTGTFSVLAGDSTRAQVEYNGHELYYFIKDKVPGDTTGQGLAGGKWQVATPGLTSSGY